MGGERLELEICDQTAEVGPYSDWFEIGVSISVVICCARDDTCIFFIHHCRLEKAVMDLSFRIAQKVVGIYPFEIFF